MATTQIHGNTQIMDLTITNSEIASNAAILTSKLADGANFLQSDGSIVLTGLLYLGGNKLINVGTPADNQDIINKTYSDANYMNYQVTRTTRTGQPPDGARTQFTLTASPLADSEQVYKNGILMEEVNEYTISTNVLTFITAPQNTDKIIVVYTSNALSYVDVIYNTTVGMVGYGIIASTFTVG